MTPSLVYVWCSMVLSYCYELQNSHNIRSMHELTLCIPRDIFTSNSSVTNYQDLVPIPSKPHSIFHKSQQELCFIPALMSPGRGCVIISSPINRDPVYRCAAALITEDVDLTGGIVAGQQMSRTAGGWWH